MLAAALSLALVGAAIADPGRKRKAKASLISGEVLLQAATHFTAFGGDGSHAGAHTTATARVAGVRRSTVDISASWDWSAFGSEHPCALVSVTPHSFPPGNLPDGPFDTGATVTITQRNGDRIDGAIRGGSNCEIATDPGPPACPVNELIIAFTITGGTGKFANASGSGVVRSVVDGCQPLGSPDVVVVDDLYLRLKKK